MRKIKNLESKVSVKETGSVRKSAEGRVKRLRERKRQRT